MTRARLAQEHGDSGVGVLYLHGFASSGASNKARHARAVVEELGVPFRAPELDGGDFRTITVGRALDVARRSCFGRTLVIGSSFGGYIASLLSRCDPRVAGLLLLAPAFDFAERLRTREGSAFEEWRKLGTVEVDHHATGQRAALDFALFEDAITRDPRPLLRAPTLIIHGARDESVPIEGSREVATRDAGFVELREVDDDHSLSQSLHPIGAAIVEMIARVGLPTRK